MIMIVFIHMFRLILMFSVTSEDRSLRSICRSLKGKHVVGALSREWCLFVTKYA